MPNLKLIHEKELFLEKRRQKNYAKATLKNNRRSLEKFFLYLNDRGITDITAVTTSHLLDYHQYLNQLEINTDGRRYSANTVNEILHTVKQFFRYLKREVKVLFDPAEGLPELRRSERFPRCVMSKREAELLLSLPDISKPMGFCDRTIMEILYSTGIRRQELLNLKVGDVDLSGGFVWVHQGKGKKDRVVPVGKTAVKYVQEYLEKVRPKLDRGKGRKELFLNPYGYALGETRFYQMLKEYVKQSKINKPISCHTFRHTCATEMLRNGASLRYVQEMLGHSNMQTTQIYTRLVPTDLKKAHQKAHPGEREKNKEAPMFNPDISHDRHQPVFFRIKKGNK
jgi:integrase/recombinase XerD